MIKKIYAILDQKSGVYGPLVLFHNDMEALRAFARLAEDLETNIGAFPEDHCLWHLGEYDDQSGYLDVDDAKVCVGFAIDLIEPRGKKPRVNSVRRKKASPKKEKK